MPTYKDKRTQRWRYRFSYEGRRYSGTAPAGSNLEKTAAALERRELDAAMAHRCTGEMPTVSTFIGKFLHHQEARVKRLTYKNQKTHLELHVAPVLGKLKLDRIDSGAVDQLVTAWKKAGAEASSINTRLGTLLRMLALAVEWKMLVAVPKATFLKVPKTAPRFLSEPEAAALLSAEKKTRSGSLEWRSMILVGLRTGLRVGELRGLQWGDVDLVRGAVHVRRTDPGIGGMNPNDPKGGRGRVIPLTPDAKACLYGLAGGTDKYQHDVVHESASRWVWPGSSSEKTRAETACKVAISKYAKAAGLSDVGWHTLRHTFASWLVMRGYTLRAVQELLGHASIKMTERYAHLSPGFINHAMLASLDVPLVTSQPALPPGDPPCRAPRRGRLLQTRSP